MTMAAKGLAKLIEECGELVQVAGKKLAYYTTDTHPDGGPPRNRRLEDEIADVIASCSIVVANLKLNENYIKKRIDCKHTIFKEWHDRTDNNQFGIDAPINYRAFNGKTLTEVINDISEIPK